MGNEYNFPLDTGYESCENRLIFCKHINLLWFTNEFGLNEEQ